MKKWVKTSVAEAYFKDHYIIRGVENVGRLGDNVGGQGLAYNQKVGKAHYVFGYPSGSHPDGNRVFSGNTLKWTYGKTFAASASAINAPGARRHQVLLHRSGRHRLLLAGRLQEHPSSGLPERRHHRGLRP